MYVLFLLSERQMARISPLFPLSHGVPRVDDRRVISGIIYVIRNGLQWKDAPKAYGPHKTLYNRFVRQAALHGCRGGCGRWKATVRFGQLAPLKRTFAFGWSS